MKNSCSCPVGKQNNCIFHFGNSTYEKKIVCLATMDSHYERCPRRRIMEKEEQTCYSSLIVVHLPQPESQKVACREVIIFLYKTVLYSILDQYHTCYLRIFNFRFERQLSTCINSFAASFFRMTKHFVVKMLCNYHRVRSSKMIPIRGQFCIILYG